MILAKGQNAAALTITKVRIWKQKSGCKTAKSHDIKTNVLSSENTEARSKDTAVQQAKRQRKAMLSAMYS